MPLGAHLPCNDSRTIIHQYEVFTPIGRQRISNSVIHGIIALEVTNIIIEELPVSYDWYRPFIHVVDKKFVGPWLQDSKLAGGFFRNLYEWDINE